MNADNDYYAYTRIPPHSIEAEHSILGGLMIDNGVLDRIADIVCEQDFYSENHKFIFRTILIEIQSGRVADVLTVCEALGDRAEKIGGLSYLGEIVANTAGTSNIKRYAEIVADRAKLRRMIAAIDQAQSICWEPSGREISSIIDEAQAHIVASVEKDARSAKELLPIASSLNRVTSRVQELWERDDPNALTGISTGLVDLDNITSGLQTSDLIIIAGRPSMGKTSLAMNIAEHVSIYGGKSVGVFSLEMQTDQITRRLIASVGGINQNNLKTGRMSEVDWSKMTHAVNKLHAAKIFIDETPAITPVELRVRARRLYRQQGELGLIVIDYLQLMKSGRANENRTTELSEISAACKALAKELNVPVIALSQLNRSLEQRSNRRPIMSDLRESGAIEQDADLIIFVYRDEVYYEDSPDRGTAELIIAKHRNGEIGTVRTAWVGHETKFKNLAADWKQVNNVKYSGYFIED